MQILRVAFFAGILLTQVSCTRSDSPAPAQVEASGTMAETSGGSADGLYAIKCPFSRRGDELTLAGYVERPGQPLGPAYVVVLKLAPADRGNLSVGSTDSGTGKGDKAHVHLGFRDRARKMTWVRYTLTNDPVKEQFSLAENPYSLDDGRVFLVDLSAEPVKVLQVKEDLASLVPAKDPGKDDLRAVLGKLKERNKKVSGFWQP